MIGRAVCETLLPLPDKCKDFDPKQTMETDQKRSFLYIILGYLWIVLIGLLVLALVCICIARRQANKEVREEVKRSVASYFSMRESESLQ